MHISAQAGISTEVGISPEFVRGKAIREDYIIFTCVATGFASLGTDHIRTGFAGFVHVLGVADHVHAVHLLTKT